MTPSLYDLLDVEPTAGDAEIRAAWKRAIADLDPTDRRFRAYNQAAEVLLDPARRAAYDEELAASAPVEDEGPESQAAVAAADAPPVTAADAQEKPASPAPTPTGRVVPAWLLAGVAVLTAVVVGLTAWVSTQPSDSAVEDASRAAQSAAERAVVPILSYDARTLDQDQQAARSYLTSDYRAEYDKLFEVIKQNAPSVGTKVEVQVVASGIVRSGEDRVDVLLFVNRPTTNKQQREPLIYRDQVTLSMEKVGEDWLVDDMTTSPVAK